MKTRMLFAALAALLFSSFAYADEFGVRLDNSGSPAAGGSGYSGSTVTINPALSARPGTCSTDPVLNVTLTGGVVTSYSVNNPGDCTVVPSNPIHASTGSATFNVKWGSLSPGIPGLSTGAFGDTSNAIATNGFAARAANIIDVFSPAGQSNDEGQSPDSTLAPTLPAGWVYQWSGGVLSQVTTGPIGNENLSGPWQAFALQWIKDTGHKIAFIPAPVGGTDQCSTTGTSTQNWSAPGTGTGIQSTATLAPALVSDVTSGMAALRTAGFTPVYRGIPWAQGENDGGSIGNSILTGVGTTTVMGGPYLAGTTAITVSSTSGMATNEFAVITLTGGASGATFTSPITVNSSTSVTLSTPIPAGYTVQNGAAFHIYQVGDYISCFQQMANYFRTTTIDNTTFPSLPIVISQLGAPSTGDVRGYQLVRWGQDVIAAQDPNTKIGFRGAVDFAAQGSMQVGCQFQAKIDNGSGSAGNILTVTSINDCTSGIIPQDVIVGSGVTGSPSILYNASPPFLPYPGTTGTGGPGTYELSGSAQLVGSEAMVRNGASSPHYTMDGYNRQGSEWAKAFEHGEAPSSGFLHQSYVLARVGIGGTLTNGDTFTITISNITGGPYTIGPVTVGSGSTFASVASAQALNIDYYDPALTNLGIYASYVTTPNGAMAYIYIPETLIPPSSTPQQIVTASWSGAVTETQYVTTANSPYGGSPDIYYNKGQVTFGGLAGRPGPDLIDFNGPSSGRLFVDETNHFPVGAIGQAAAGSDNIVARFGNNIDDNDNADHRASLLFEPDMKLVDFDGDTGPCGAFIEAEHEPITGFGRADLTLGGYACPSKMTYAKFFASGGIYFGSSPFDPGAGNLAVQGTINYGGTLLDNAAWITYTPTFACDSGTVGAATTAGRYKVIGKTVFVWVSVDITSLGTCNTDFSVSEPSLPISADVPLSGWDSSLGSVPVVVTSGGGIIFGGVPAAHQYYANGVYESQ